MKKVFVLLTAIGFLISSCNNNKNSKNNNSREKDDYGKTENKTGDEKGNTGWSEMERNSTLKECIGSFEDDQMALANQICPCVLGKLEKEYPTYNEADKKGGEAAVERIALQCREEIIGNNGNTNNNNTTGSWSSAFVNNYIDNCVSSAVANGMERGRAQQYCSCMQKKFENMYPDVTDLDKLTEEDAINLTTRFAQGCIPQK